MKTIVARLKQTHIYPVTWNFTCSKKINIWPLFKVICFRVIFFFFFFRLTISYVFMHTENLKNPIEYQTCFRYKRGQREPKWTKHFKWELFFLIPSLICMQFIHWITVCPNRKEFHIKEFNNFFFINIELQIKIPNLGVCLLWSTQILEIARPTMSMLARAHSRQDFFREILWWIKCIQIRFKMF